MIIKMIFFLGRIGPLYKRNQNDNSNIDLKNSELQDENKVQESNVEENNIFEPEDEMLDLTPNYKNKDGDNNE